MLKKVIALQKVGQPWRHDELTIDLFVTKRLCYILKHKE